MPRNLLFTLTLLCTFVSAASAQGQKPMVLDESTVVAGTQRTPTQYLYAMGKWSDATDAALSNSTQIHCYQAFGFCEVASADSVGGGVYVRLDTFDILRWDRNELIAVDSSPICVANTLRIDFRAKNVALSSTSKGETRDPMCKEAEKTPTAFLGGAIDEIKKKEDRLKK
jgi:hypothetical protein